MKIGKNKLKMSDGSIRTFKSQEARENFERMAQAAKHGWKPDQNKRQGHKKSRPKSKAKR